MHGSRGSPALHTTPTIDERWNREGETGSIMRTVSPPRRVTMAGGEDEHGGVIFLAVVIVLPRCSSDREAKLMVKTMTAELLRRRQN